MDFKGTWASLPDSDWFYNIMEICIIYIFMQKTLGLIGLRLILLYTGFRLIKSINKAGMLLEKYESLLGLSVQQLVIESSSISLDQMCGVCVKNQTFCYWQS